MKLKKIIGALLIGAFVFGVGGASFNAASAAPIPPKTNKIYTPSRTTQNPPRRDPNADIKRKMDEDMRREREANRHRR